MPIFNQNTKTRGASSRRPKPSRSFDWRRLQQFFLMLVLVLLVAVVHQAVTKLLSLPVSRVVVNGDFSYVDKTAVVTEIEPFLLEGFLLLDLVGVREQLLTMPWIFDVSVSRRLPSEVVINVREQKPIARWGKQAYLNYRGELFKPTAPLKSIDNVEVLPFLYGPDNTAPQVMTYFREFNDVLGAKNMSLVTLGLTDRGIWVAQLDNGIKIVLGSGEIMEKMQRLLIAYEAGLDANFGNIKKIDMRYSNGFAVDWRDKKSLKG